MKQAGAPCDPDRLMRYIDRELNAQEQVEMDNHLRSCAGCRQTVREELRLSAVVQKTFARAVAAGPLDGVEEAVFARVGKQTGKDSRRIRTGARRFPWKTVLVPATALAAVALFYSIFGPFQESREPSAIINSFTAETSSVMILETPETHRTILWFQEKSG